MKVKDIILFRGSFVRGRLCAVLTVVALLGCGADTNDGHGTSDAAAGAANDVATTGDGGSDGADAIGIDATLQDVLIPLDVGPADDTLESDVPEPDVSEPDVSEDADANSGEPTDPDCPSDDPAAYPWASEVVELTLGLNGGFGENKLPDVVLGAPVPGPPNSGALDVLSLGIGGEIVLGFGSRRVVDGPGVDFIIWENAFWVGGNPEAPYAELAEVSVSADGDQWHSFICDPDSVESGFPPNCAGWRPRQEFDVCARPLAADVAGGDGFDLADLGLAEIRYIRIRDLADSGAPPSAGFDLDAVGAVHLQ